MSLRGSFSRFRALRVSVVLVSLLACHGKHHAREDAAAAKPKPVDAAQGFPELASFPHVEPVRVIALPTRPDVPRFDLGGPVMLGDVAVVSSSQFGFLAVDYHAGHVAWTKPAGSRVAPPVVIGGSAVLIGECLNAQPVKDTLLGCLRVVTATGADQSYLAIHGRGVDEFAASPGDQRVWQTGEHEVIWRHGDEAVTVDLMTGVATRTLAGEPPLVVHAKGHTWTITQDETGVIRAAGTPPWQTSQEYSQLIGAVYLPGQGPMVRATRAGAFGGHPEVNVFDIDATGSLHGQVAFPVPGIGLIGHAVDSVGDTALAVRLDTSLERDFIAGYAANALLMWVWPLPRQPRPDPVGLAVANDAVVVFHDGDTLTVLPELLAPPTAPGAARPPSENATP
jgi:hypothetical protein